MNILQLRQLNKKQKKAIEQLVGVCLEFDHIERTLYLDNNLNYYEDLDCFFLLYDGENLISVLTILQPSEAAAEISAYTLPTLRRKGYFKELLKNAFDTLAKFPIYDILFVVEPNSSDGLKAVKASGGNYIKSEYLLSLDLCQVHIEKVINNSTIGIKLLKADDIIDAIDINIETLGTTSEEADYMFSEVTESKEMDCYCAIFQNIIVGICCVNYGALNASIFGLGVRKQYQSSGYGRVLLTQVINNIKAKGINKILLQVSSESKEAFCLYKSVGFQVKTQYDYYEYFLK